MSMRVFSQAVACLCFLLVLAVGGLMFLDYLESVRISRTVNQIVRNDIKQLEQTLAEDNSLSAWQEYSGVQTLRTHLASPNEETRGVVGQILIKLRHAEGANAIPAVTQLTGSLEAYLQNQRTVWVPWQVSNPLQEFVLSRAETAPGVLLRTKKGTESEKQFSSIPKKPLRISTTKRAIPKTAKLDFASKIQRSEGMLAQADTAFTPPTLEKFQAAQKNILDKMEALELLLREDAAKEAGWKLAIHWETLTAAVATDEFSVDALRDVFAQLSRGAAGLELERFAALRRAIGDYLLLADCKENSTQIQAECEKRTAELSTRLTEAKAAPTADGQRSAEEAVRWLRAMGQAEALTAEAKTFWSQPNVVVTVRGDLLSRYSEQIQQTQEIHESVANAQIQGSADFTGLATVRLVPNPDRVAMSVELNGNAVGKSYAYSHPVHVWSNSDSKIHAEKHLSFDSCGAYAENARATIKGNSQITGIRDRCDRPLIEQIAWKKANEQKGQTQATLSQRHARKMGQEMDARINPPLQELNHRIAQDFWPQLMARGIRPESVRMFSEAEWFQVESHLGEWTAPTSAPAFEKAAQMEISIHETAIQNLASALLGGMNCDAEARAQIKKTLPTVLRDVLDKAEQKQAETEKKNPDAWGIAFPEFWPVTATFAEGKMNFVVHADAIQGSERAYPAVDITIVYRPEVRDGVLFLVQDKPIDILPPTFDPARDKRLPAEIVSLRRVMSRRLGEVLPKEIELKPIPIREKEGEEPKWTVVPDTLTVNNGWLQIGLQVTN